MAESTVSSNQMMMPGGNMGGMGGGSWQWRSGGAENPGGGGSGQAVAADAHKTASRPQNVRNLTGRIPVMKNDVR